MQDILIEQLSDMRRTLSQNIESIRSLLEASISLGRLISQLSKKEGNAKEVTALKETQKTIGESINNLLQQAESFFEAYKKMAKNI